MPAKLLTNWCVRSLLVSLFVLTLQPRYRNHGTKSLIFFLGIHNFDHFSVPASISLEFYGNSRATVLAVTERASRLAVIKDT